MKLILSDIHFGKSDPDSERKKEADVVSLLKFYGDEISHLYLLGDIYDHYIEYRHTLPKGYTRFLGQLGSISDSGVPVTYFYGNHDPWHRDFFETEFGAEVVEDFLRSNLSGLRIFMTHGDGKASKQGMYSILRPILRHPFPTTLYRYIFPGDMGLALARWSSRNFSAKETNMETVSLMREFAGDVLADSVDIVIMGHCHHAELTEDTNGIYLNTGSWHHERTFGILTEDEIALLSWNDGQPDPKNTIPLAQKR